MEQFRLSELPLSLALYVRLVLQLTAGARVSPLQMHSLYSFGPRVLPFLFHHKGLGVSSIEISSVGYSLFFFFFFFNQQQSF